MTLPDHDQEAQRLLAAIVESSDDAIIGGTLDGIIVSWNPGAERLYGYSAAEIVGRPVTILFPPDRPDELPQILAKLRRGEHVQHFETVRVRKDGRRVDISLSVSPITDAAGNLIGTSSIGHDITNRKKAEEALRVSEERFRTTFEQAPLGIVLIESHTGQFLQVNPKYCEIVGRTREEMLQLDFQSITHPDDVQPSLDNQRRLIEGQIRSFTAEKRYLRPDGATVWVSLTVVPMWVAGESADFHIAMVEDITERVQAREALRERERHAALGAEVGAALVQSDDLPEMLQHSAEALVKHLDAAFARIWTLNPEQNVLELRASAGLYTHIDGSHSRVPVGQFKIGQIARTRQPHLTNSVIGDPLVHDQEWAKREGMIAFAGYPLLIEGRPVGVVALFARQPLPETTLQALASVSQEIALGIERKRAEEDLRNSEARLRAILDNSPAAIYIKDSESRFLLVNRESARILGTTPDGAIGKTDYDLYADRAIAERMIVDDRRVIESGETMTFEEPAPLPDGIHTFVSVKFPLHDAAGQIYAVCGISTDITERKRNEEFREEYISLISHDLRQPLTMILGLSSWLSRTLEQQGLERDAHTAKTLVSSANRMNSMIRELVDSARLEAGQIKMQPEPTDLCHLISEIMERVGTLEERRRVTWECPEWVPLAMVDREQLERVIVNLITNALKYSPPDSEVVLRLEKSGDQAVISVVDHGIGIAVADLPHIFDRFYRTKTGTKRAEGLGLGLYISRLIVEAHGGRIWVESEVRKGSTFHFALPLA